MATTGSLVLSLLMLTTAPVGAQSRSPAEARTATVGIPPLRFTVIGFSGLTGLPALDANRARSSLDAGPQLAPLIDRMWKGSPTFRRQCTRLAAESVRVVVFLDPRLDAKRALARTSIRMKDGRLASASTGLGAAHPELLAHEVEHVLEAADGVDLSWAVGHRLAGASSAGGGLFETARASAIGRLVAHELETDER
jgi:hypothetical protein